MQHQEVNIDQADLEREILKRSVQGVLNKLTPQKFGTLLTQLKNLNFDTEEKLNVVVDLIFETAIDQPNFSVPYANLCKHLALIKVPLAGGQTGQQVKFRQLLLTKCQKEFEQDRRDELKHEERIEAMENAEPDKKKEMKMVYDVEGKKIRYRQLGNIRFIGELFKLGMLIEPIMHECIKKLLAQGDEESLECLCRLLKRIGKELDEGKSNKNTRETIPMDAYFSNMQKIVEKRLTSSRVRFMLQDVIDLKKNNWVPKRDENNPKTIDQNMSNYPKRMPDDRDWRKGAGRTIGQSEDGWTSSTKSSKGTYFVPTKLKLTKKQGHTKPKIIEFKIPLHHSIKLHESENAWKPLYKMEHDIVKKEKLKRNIQAVLNKLTFQKFKILLVHLKKLNIATDDELDLVVDLIYENAVHEPHFGVVYANLCKHLSLSQNMFGELTEDFCTRLLMKCQQEFDEKCKKNNRESKMNDKDLKLQLQCDEERRRAKARCIGNIRFIGELCNMNMIPCPILEECIEILLKCDDEESLECVFWLMKITGKHLESSSDSKRTLVQEYMTQIQEIVDKQSTSSRIRCLLMDIIDLKENKWVPRRNENTPRTIDEIHKEAALEARKQMKIFQIMLSNAKNFSHPVETNSDNATFECSHESKVSSKDNHVIPSQVDKDDSEIADEVKRILLGQRIQTSKDDKEKKTSTLDPEKDVTSK